MKSHATVEPRTHIASLPPIDVPVTRIDVFRFTRAQIRDRREAQASADLRVALAFRMSELARTPIGVTIAHQTPRRKECS